MYDELVKRLREDAADGYLIYTRIGDDIAQAADAIEALSKMETTTPRWISVEDALPEPYEAVLLYNGEEIATGYMLNVKRFTLNASHYPSRPTHWMPLPSPPKEET